MKNSNLTTASTNLVLFSCIFAILCLTGCSSNPSSEAKVLSPKELTRYSNRIARFSNSVSNPFNWGASPEEMEDWGKKVGWEMSSPLAEIEGKPGIKSVTYWLYKGEADYRQMMILSFRANKLKAVAIMVLEGMDATLKSRHNDECSLLEENVWHCEKVHVIARRRTFENDVATMWDFIDSSEADKEAGE